MKKTIKLLLVATLIACGTVLCQASDIKIKSGKMPKFSAEQTISLEVDYSKATWDESGSLKRFYYKEYRDEFFESEMAEAYETFIQKMNEMFADGFKQAGSLLVVDGDADYSLFVTIKNFHESRHMWDRTTDVFGEAELIDNATGEVVCVIDINGIEGDEIQDREQGTISAMENTGWSISHRMKKSVDNIKNKKNKNFNDGIYKNRK